MTNPPISEFPVNNVMRIKTRAIIPPPPAPIFTSPPLDEPREPRRSITEPGPVGSFLNLTIASTFPKIHGCQTIDAKWADSESRPNPQMTRRLVRPGRCVPGGMPVKRPGYAARPHCPEYSERGPDADLCLPGFSRSSLSPCDPAKARSPIDCDGEQSQPVDNFGCRRGSRHGVNQASPGT